MTRSLVPGGHYDVDTDTICFSCRAREKIERDDRKNHEKKQETFIPGRDVGGGQHNFHHEDGRRYTVRETAHDGL